MMKREIVITSDGSTTIHLPDWNEQYHSKHGAIQEAYHVFIRTGFDRVLERKKEGFSILKKQTIGNVTRDGENSITINLSLIDNDEFSTTNMLLSLMEASNRILADSLNLSENQRIHFFMKTFCSSLADKTSNGAKFWTGKYLTIFQQLHEKELVETFTNILL